MVNSNPYNNQNASFIPRSVSKSQNLYFLEFMLIIFFFAYYLLPAVASTVPFMVALFIGIGYLAYIFLREPYWRVLIAGFLLITFVISLMFFFFTETSTISISASNYALKRIASKMNQFFMMFFPACLFVRIYTKASKKQIKALYFIACALFAFVIINTFVELMKNVGATRDWTAFTEQNENNIGTYAFVYVVPMLVTALTSLLYTKKGGKKLLVLGIMVFLFVFLLSAQYTLAILISVIGIALQISANTKSIAGKLLLWIFFAALLFIVPFAFDFLANVIKSEQISVRFKELAAFFGGGDASGYNLSGRLELYWKTIVAFFKSPIIGNRSLDFDGHATLLTVPADIGIFGLVSLWLLILKSKKYISACMGERKKQFTPVIVCLIIMGFTNPIHGAPAAMFGALLFAPMIVKIGDNNG